MRAAATSAALVPAAGETRSTTLLELVRAIGEVTADDREVVLTVLHLLRSGRVRLRGCMRDEPLASFET
jgi:hypothetical protein